MFPVFGAEPKNTREPPKDVLLEFVVVEVAGGSSRALELPGSGVLSKAPTEVGHVASAAITGPDLESTVSALARDARVRILQRPRIQTSDQIPATLFVGEVPARQSRGGPAGEPVTTGLTLDATPFIGPDRLITLDLHLKQVTCDGMARTKGGLVPIATTRETQAKITVRDRATMLMAGLVTPAQEKPGAMIRFPKELPGMPASGAVGINRSKPAETVLLVRPTLLQN